MKNDLLDFQVVLIVDSTAGTAFDLAETMFAVLIRKGLLVSARDLFSFIINELRSHGGVEVNWVLIRGDGRWLQSRGLQGRQGGDDLGLLLLRSNRMDMN